MGWTSCALLFAAGLLVSASSPPPAAEAAQNTYTFRTPPADGMGVKSLNDLRGRPVLIDFWGTR